MNSHTQNTKNPKDYKFKQKLLVFKRLTSPKGIRSQKDTNALFSFLTTMYRPNPFKMENPQNALPLKDVSTCL